ncbi:MAG: hypothetical protein AAFU64_12160 [Bacteroidota bacterium]
MIQARKIIHLQMLWLVIVFLPPVALEAAPCLSPPSPTPNPHLRANKVQKKTRLLAWVFKKLQQKEQKQRRKIEKWRKYHPKKYQRYQKRRALGRQDIIKGIFRWFFKILLYALLFSLAVLLGVALAGAILGGIGWGVLAAFGATEGISFWAAVGTGAALALTTTVTIVRLSR